MKSVRIRENITVHQLLDFRFHNCSLLLSLALLSVSLFLSFSLPIVFFAYIREEFALRKTERDRLKERDVIESFLERDRERGGERMGGGGGGAVLEKDSGFQIERSFFVKNNLSLNGLSKKFQDGPLSPSFFL